MSRVIWNSSFYTKLHQFSANCLWRGLGTEFETLFWKPLTHAFSVTSLDKGDQSNSTNQIESFTSLCICTITWSTKAIQFSWSKHFFDASCQLVWKGPAFTMTSGKLPRIYGWGCTTALSNRSIIDYHNHNTTDFETLKKKILQFHLREKCFTGLPRAWSRLRLLCENDVQYISKMRWESAKTNFIFESTRDTSLISKLVHFIFTVQSFK